MNPLLILFSFAVGLLAQVFLLTDSLPLPGKGRRQILLVFSFSAAFVLLPVAAGFPGRPWTENLYTSFVLAALVFSAVAIGVLFLNQSMPRIGQGDLLSFTLVFWLVYLSEYRGPSFLGVLCGVWGILATVGTLLIVCLRLEMDFLSKLFFYTWFLTIVFYVCCYQVLSGDLELIFFRRGWDQLMQFHPVAAFFSGMAVFCFMAYGFYSWLAFDFLFKLIFRGSRYARTRGGKKWEIAERLTGHFSDVRIGFRAALAVVVLQGGFYLLNSRYHLVPLPLLVNFSIVLLPFLFMRLLGRLASPPPPSKAD